jgi:hypothetical protein
MSALKLQREKEKLIAHYKQCLETMISDSDFTRYFGNEVQNQILKYSDLANYKTIYDLLPEQKDFRIILTETKQNEGHWCCILRYPYNGKDTIEWFDPYGVRPDGELTFISTAMKKLLGENKHYLSALINTINKSKTDFIYNKTKFQQLADGINTCGRWTICRILMMRFGYNLEEFDDFIHRNSEAEQKPPDILVCDWIK